jgi:hypothetical protein
MIRSLHLSAGAAASLALRRHVSTALASLLLGLMPPPALEAADGTVIAGTATLPVITSPAVVAGTAGKPFSYRIVSSGSPAIYRATNLPLEFAVNCATGEITGVPTTARTINITVHATNAVGTHSTVVSVIVASPKERGQP